MIYPLVPYTDLILKEELEKFDFSNPPVDPIQLAKDLVETMIHNEGIGLAANQIGLPYRVFSVYCDPILCLFNPTIIDVSSEEVLLDEGCLSFPGISVKVRRPKSIKVRYTQANGEVITSKYTGMTARVILHEYSHLQGRTMLDDCSIIQKEKALNKLKKMKRISK